MLPLEEVTRPVGNAYPIVMLWHIDKVYLMLGRHWQEVYTRQVAMCLATVQDAPACVVWREIQVTDEKRHCFYIVPEEPGSLDPLMARLRSETSPTGVDTLTSLPEGALPVLRRLSGGRVLRLWPSPPPKVPRRQTIKIDWIRFQVHNTIFELTSKLDS